MSSPVEIRPVNGCARLSFAAAWTSERPEEISGWFSAVRTVMVARPSRQRWNRHMLSSLWADIGLRERDIA
jgi:hypothetical protein